MHSTLVSKIVDSFANPDREILIYNETSLSQKQFNIRVKTGIDLLRSYNLPPGKPIAIILEKSLNIPPLAYSIMTIGAIFTPLSCHNGDERNRKILTSLEPSAIIVSPEKKQLTEAIYPNAIVISFDEKRFEQSNKELLLPDLFIHQSNLQDPAYIIPTSGSSGIPKCVAVSYGSLLNLIQWYMDYTQAQKKDNFGMTSPFFFDMSIPDLFSLYFHPGSLILFPDQAGMFPLKILEIIKNRNVSKLLLVPSLLKGLIACDKDKSLSLLSDLYTIGEVLPLITAKLFLSSFPSVNLHNLYGPTEATFCCSAYHCLPEELKNSDSVSLGSPRNGVQLSLENEEILIAGDCLSLGYWNNPKETAKSFFTNKKGIRWYRTGDRGMESGREFFFKGRLDRQIQKRGHRIELGEIEEVLSHSFSIKKIAVLYNKETEQLHGFYQKNENYSNKKIIKDLKRIEKESLPPYMWIKKHSILNFLPVLTNGKLDYKKLEKEV